MLRRSLFFSAAAGASAASASSASAASGKPFLNPSDKDVAEKLRGLKTLVVLGLSDDPRKPSYHVVDELIQRQGQADAAIRFEVIPVRPDPEGKSILGFQVKTLAECADIVKADSTIVDVFRRSEAIPEVMAELQKLGAKNVWLQHGVKHDSACTEAREKHGMFVIQDKCILLEHQRLVPEQW